MKINRKNIVKYAGIGVLITVVLSDVVITSAKCNKTNHTNEVCPYTIHDFEYGSKQDGIDHQISEMEREYEKLGMDDSEYFIYYQKERTYVSSPIIEKCQVKNEDGSITFINCQGYEHYYFGHVAIKPDDPEHPYLGGSIKQPITNFNEDGTITIYAPKGYELVKTGRNAKASKTEYQKEGFVVKEAEYPHSVIDFVEMPEYKSR